MKKLKVAEIWAGKESCSKVARELGHETWTTDINPEFNSDLTGDMLIAEIQEQIMERVRWADVVWMSPVCTVWSLSAGNTYWDEYRMPRNDKAIDGIKMMLFSRLVADYCIKHNKIFFIENPNGRAVWIMDNQYLKRCWYCQYGDTRAKPTNIWTNLPGWEPKTCHNFKKGQPKHCHHEAAPRGSKTGTQGLKGNMERSIIPSKLFHEIFHNVDNLYKEKKNIGRYGKKTSTEDDRIIKESSKSNESGSSSNLKEVEE